MAGEDVVPASELVAAVKQIKELQRLLGKKTMENELLQEAVEYGRQKKWIAHAPSAYAMSGCPNCSAESSDGIEWHPHGALGYRSPREYLRRRRA